MTEPHQADENDGDAPGGDTPDAVVDARPEIPVPPDGLPGTGIIRASLVGTALFTVLGVLGSISPDVFGLAFLAVSMIEFAIGTVVFFLAFLRAVDRSRTETIGIGGLFFAAGTAPRPAQRALIGSLVVQTTVAIVVGIVRIYSVMAFGIMAPMWALGLTGLWVSAHGTFPAHAPELTRAGRRDADRRAHRAAGSTGPRERTE